MCSIDYADLIQKEKLVLDYAFRISSYFSIVAKFGKPYSQIPPNFKNPAFAQSFAPFLLKYIFDRNEWPIKSLSRSKHQVLVFYKSCKESREKINEFSNVFLPYQNDLPEDICFYRNSTPWLATISHEKIAFLSNAITEDYDFFQKQNIHFSELT